MRVLLVGENASARMGGESAAPYNYFRYLPGAGVEPWLVTHARVREELTRDFPDRIDHVRFIEDTRLDRFLYRLSRLLPDKIAGQTVGVLARTIGQFRLRRIARALIPAVGIDVVHQVYPISPKEPSLFHSLGVPVVIGPPLSGGMRIPPGFRHREGRVSRMVEWVGRYFAGFFNRLIPGKRRAAALLVANSQTRAALPAGCRGLVYDTVGEVCVDDVTFSRSGSDPTRVKAPNDPVRFVYLGRLVDWKALDQLLPAFAAVVAAVPPPGVTLEILGDGPERSGLESLARSLGLGSAVRFAGWVTAAQAAERLKAADVFVLPSLRESGGIVVTEAMAVGLPVIVTDWGGPALTVDPTCGFRVPPTSPDAFQAGLTEAMVTLARSPSLRSEMGRAAAARVRSGAYSWSTKAERTVAVYRDVLNRPV